MVCLKRLEQQICLDHHGHYQSEGFLGQKWRYEGDNYPNQFQRANSELKFLEK